MEHYKTRNSLRMAAVLMSLLLLVNLGIGFFLAKQARITMKEEVERRMLDVTNLAASMIDGDALESLQAEDKRSQKYQEILRTLGYFRDNVDLKYIYCIRHVDAQHYIFTVDPTKADPAEFGEEVVYTSALDDAAHGMPSVDDTAYRDDWGAFYSAYSPVYDSFGKIAGVVAADFSTEWYERAVNGYERRIISSYVFLTVVGIGLVAAISLSVRKRIRDLDTELEYLESDIEDFERGVANYFGESAESILSLRRRSEASPSLEGDMSMEGRMKAARRKLGIYIEYLHSK
ncbi:MAG: cache domain-containing protein [Lachnospiraceae bacterium]|nr:cache domain-containing protein [Lachnospiraceae bacterium]